MNLSLLAVPFRPIWVTAAHTLVGGQGRAGVGGWVGIGWEHSQGCKGTWRVHAGRVLHERVCVGLGLVVEVAGRS